MKNITVEVELRGTARYDLTKADIKRIAEDYKGDYLSYIEDNSEIYDLDKERFLKACEITTSEFEEIYRDTERLKLERTDELEALMNTADYQNPRLEFNDVYFDDDYIVSTDTKRMMVVKNTTDIKNVYIPKPFLDLFVHFPDNELDVVGQNVILTSNDRHFHYFPTHRIKYPDYERIVPKETKTKISYEKFLKDSKVLLADGFEYPIDLRIMKIDGKTLCLNNDLIMEDFNFDTFCFNESYLPIMFENENARYIVMPIILSEEKTKSLLQRLKRL